MYEKELEIRLSRSYGPGRYSAEYELHGQDLPIEYVRWTEQRNLQAFIELLESRRLDPSALTTHRFPVDSAEHAYAAVEASEPRAFGVLLEYQDADEPTVVFPPPSHAVRRSPGDRIGLIGAGSFARSVLLPALAEMGVTLESVASDTGLSATDVAHRFGFARSATAEQVIADDRVDAVVIATRHSSHARWQPPHCEPGRRCSSRSRPRSPRRN